MNNDKFKQLDSVQRWLRENQARGCDEIFMAKVAEMKQLMSELYTITPM